MNWPLDTTKEGSSLLQPKRPLLSEREETITLMNAVLSYAPAEALRVEGMLRRANATWPSRTALATNRILELGDLQISANRPADVTILSGHGGKWESNHWKLNVGDARKGIRAVPSQIFLVITGRNHVEDRHSRGLYFGLV